MFVHLLLNLVEQKKNVEKNVFVWENSFTMKFFLLKKSFFYREKYK